MLCVICGGENDTKGCHLAGFGEDLAFTCHFVATHPPPTLTPSGSANGISYASKKTIENGRKFS